MKIYDISWPVFNGMTEYKDRSVLHIKQTKTFEKDYVRESLITIGSHTGTHIDSSAHFLKEGKSVEEVNPLLGVGPAQVIDMTHLDNCIDAVDIDKIEIKPNLLVLFKTKNSQLDVNAPFDHNFIYVTAAAAQKLLEKQVRGVGIDYLGIERNQPNHETHTTFMEHDIAIIEGLRLAHVNAGDYFMWCLPISLPGIDAAPARAVLIEE